MNTPNLSQSNTRSNNDSGVSDTSHTEQRSTWGGADTLDEWDNGASNHLDVKGGPQQPLVGNDTARAYNDATGFLSEGMVEAKVMDDSKEDRMMEQFIRPSAEQQHSIERIMSRPVKIDTITFSTSQNAGTIIGNYDIIQEITTNARFALLREKLSSFYGVNMRAHLKVTLNAQPMESGLFQIFFIPFYRSFPPAVDPLTNAPGNLEAILPYTSGCPNMPCNVSKQSEIELVVPYTGPVSFINLTNANADFGTYFIQSIVPITDNTNNANCELSVYMYFDNVELFGTTPNSVVAQPQGIDIPQPPSNEADMKKKGPLSTIGNSLLPILDSLGLSSPDANPNVDRMVIDPYSSPATVDTTKSPLKVSYTFKHHLNIGHLGVNNQIDEMDINSIIYKPTYYNQFQWSNAQTENTLLYRYKVEPNCIIYPDENQTSPTRLRYMANCFRYWRGTIRFLFMVVANQYHSGRLRFVYSLGGPTPGTPVNNYPRTFTQVVDIRKGSHFIVECPYFASTPWRPVPQVWDNTAKTYTNPDVGILDDQPGYLEVYVENALRVSQVTSPSVQVVSMVAAGNDFEFAVPIAPTTFGSYFYSRAPQALASIKNEDFAELQGLDFKPIDMVSGNCGTETSGSPHQYTVGEKVSNVRSLIKRYQLLGSGQFTLNADNAFRDFVLYPFAFRRGTGASTYTYEMLSYFRPMYRFQRGSVRYLLTTSDRTLQYTVRYDPEASDLNQPASANDNIFGSKVPIRSITAWPTGSSLASVPLTATVPYATDLSGGLEIEFPYYSRFHKVPTINSIDDANYPAYVRMGYVPAGTCYFQVYDSKTTNDNFIFTHVYRAAADDFTYGYLLGAPITVNNQLLTL